MNTCAHSQEYCRNCCEPMSNIRCFGQRNEAWKLRKLRLMFIIPLVLLPLMILGIVVYNAKIAHIRDLDTQTAELPVPEQYVAEENLGDNEASGHELLKDMQTMFVPSPTHYHSGNENTPNDYRKKRDVEDVLTPILQNYEGNVSSEELVWTVAQAPISIKMPSQSRVYKNNIVNRYQRRNTTRRVFSTKQSTIGSGKTPADVISEPERSSEELVAGDEKKQIELNRLANKYPGEIIPDIDEDEDPFDGFKVVPDDSSSQEIPTRKPWSLHDYQDYSPGNMELEDDTLNSPNEDQDFHLFWRDQGSKDSIMKAQATMMRNAMNLNISPCEDFYKYACGNWDIRNPIPKDKGGYDTFEKLRESLDLALKGLLEEPVETSEYGITTDSATNKAKLLYKSCMNVDILRTRGEQPLVDLLNKFGGWPMIDPYWDSKNFDWLELAAELRLYNNDIFISEWVGPDIMNSDEYVMQLDQSSLGLPTREYFLNIENSMYLSSYKDYIVTVATILGTPLDSALKQADDIIVFEKHLALIMIAADERDNITELYNRMTLGEFQSQLPEVDWFKYMRIVLNRTPLNDEDVVIFAMGYFRDLVDLIYSTQPEVISNYLLWRFVRHRVNQLDDRFREAKQIFYFELFGREESPSRWKTCISQVNSNMGMAVGAMFVKKYFDDHSKQDTVKMTEGIMKSFRELLSTNDWIDSKTKEIAQKKVDSMVLRIGYPELVLSPDKLNERYHDIEIHPDTYFENTLNILKHLTRLEHNRLGQVVNKTTWSTAPAIVNAYYSRNKNQIMFPAGILQPPFYHRYFPRSLNFGGIGVVIGHEITHGFDDKGRLFDQFGNLHRWWQDSSIQSFHIRAQCLIDQYNQFIMTEVDMPVDGQNTQGENIADNGGVKQAFRAYSDWLEKNEDDTLPGMNITNEQLFFVNFAQVWCGSMRPEALRNKLQTAVHSPGRYRVIGALSNSEDFARVFKCQPGSPMNPTHKCSVW